MDVEWIHLAENEDQWGGLWRQ